MNPHNLELVRRLENVIGHLRNAAVDAAVDFECGLGHATIALDCLKQVVADGKAARSVHDMGAHEAAETFDTDDASEEEAIQAECDRVAGRE
ncbi:MAG: hypothetical protein KGJ13_10475 [Patescibacteria group bacterium]|nr:hypothetical protein [Patescibacteria group bacterium]